MFEDLNVSSRTVEFLSGDWWEVLLRVAAVIGILIGAITGIVKFAYFTTKQTVLTFASGLRGIKFTLSSFCRLFRSVPKPPSPPSFFCSRLLKALTGSECLWDDKGLKGEVLCGDLIVTMSRQNLLSDWHIASMSLAGCDPLDHMDIEDRERVYRSVRDVIARTEDEVTRSQLKRMVEALSVSTSDCPEKDSNFGYIWVAPPGAEVLPLVKP